MGRIIGSWAQVMRHVGSHHLVFGNISSPSLEVARAARDSRSVTHNGTEEWSSVLVAKGPGG